MDNLCPPEGGWALILVNAQHPLPGDFEPDTALLSLGKPCDRRIAPVVERLFCDAQIGGVELLLRSGYRSIPYQKDLYEDKIRRVIEEEGADPERAPDLAAMVVARPGTSEHHTGLAFDILSPEYDSLDEEFCRTKAYAWLCAHAVDYGFVLRYPADKTPVTGIVYEPWHWRYVGPCAAHKMNRLDLCLEEYVERLAREQK